MTRTSAFQAATFEPLSPTATPAQAAVTFGAEEHACILESSLPDPTYGRYSICAADPVTTVAIPADCDDPLGELAQHIGARSMTGGAATAMPYCGGWFGYLSYEAGLATEGIRPGKTTPADVPTAVMSLYDALALFDHDKQQWYAATPELADGYPQLKPRAERIERIVSRLERAATVSIPEVIAEPATTYAPAMSPDAYLAAARRIKEYIAAGDIYQANLTQRWDARTSATPLELYMRLRAASPAPHAALVRFDGGAVISASPELFVHTRGDRIVTRPIKGTRPRVGSADVDARALAALQASEKDRAELNMIIDLLRNDVGRVAELGSVRVVDADCIETHPTVFHRVATIEARLREATNWTDVLRATLPGGSVTGAPKIRAMQIIDELEPVARGPYCGVIGWIGLDGSMAFNLAIRTMTQRADEVFIHAGGAIVADSDPFEEYDETLAKAAAAFRALGCTPPEPMTSPCTREECLK